MSLLEVRGLRLEVPSRSGTTAILRGLSLEVAAGEVLGLVGETGAGKSMAARAILGLPVPKARLSFEHFTFDGRDLRDASGFRDVRGRLIGFVPQHPRASLNPVFTVGNQLREAVGRLRGLGRRAARAVALELLGHTRIADPERCMRAYPHQLSGGMCQRVCIAIALAGNPRLIIADEPTTGLDVTVQADILMLLRNIIAENRTAAILITHDIGVVAQICDRVAVMYAGRIVDCGSAIEVFEAPLHPYAAKLLGIARALDGGREPEAIPGYVPSPGEPLPACAFAPRCDAATDECRRIDPPAVRRGGQIGYTHHPVAVPAARVGASGT
jgi:oligopeptide/dipeptide ABC transporter ATP-binding protein